jgi:hypothetical protein
MINEGEANMYQYKNFTTLLVTLINEEASFIQKKKVWFNYNSTGKVLYLFLKNY